MQTTEGALHEIGNSLQTNQGTTYSYINIGDTMLQQVVVPRGLDNFFRKGLSSSESTTIYSIKISNKILIVGVKTPDGKLFYHEQSATLGYLSLIVGIPLIIVLIGIPMVIQGGAILQAAAASKEVRRLGGTGIA